METNFAFRLASLVVATKVDVDGFSTSTLRVLDSGSVLLARDWLLFAGRTIVHRVMEIDLDIKFNGHVDCGDTETILPLVTTKRSRLRFAAFVLDGLATKCPLGECVAFADWVGAFPVFRKVEVTILKVGVAVLEIGPVESTLLLVATLVVRVLWRLERLTRDTPGSSYLLGGNARQNSISGLHGECGRCRTVDWGEVENNTGKIEVVG
jgi:hypothetical protein